MKILQDHELLKKHLTESQIKYLRTKDFFDKLIHEVSELLTIRSAVDFVVRSSSQKLVQAPRVINGCYDLQGPWFESAVFIAFLHLLKKGVQDRLTFIPNYHFITDNSLNDQFVKRGSFAKMARKMMISNMALPPVVIEEHSTLNKLGLPSYYPVEHEHENNVTLEAIVHIGKSMGV